MNKKDEKTPVATSTTPTLETLSLDSLVVDPANVRLHGDRNRQTLDASFRRFGAARSIVVDAKGVVRAGNGTLEAARAAGMTDAIVVDAEGDQLIVVRRKDWSPTEATAYAIADNRSSDLAEDDPDALARTLQALMNEGFDLAATGFSEEEANSLIDGLGSYGSDGDGEPSEEEATEVDDRNVIRVTPEQRITIERAILRIRTIHASRDLSEGWCVARICDEFLREPT